MPLRRQLAARSKLLPAVTVNAEPDALQATLVVAPTRTLARGCETCPPNRVPNAASSLSQLSRDLNSTTTTRTYIIWNLGLFVITFKEYLKNDLRMDVRTKTCI